MKLSLVFFSLAFTIFAPSLAAPLPTPGRLKAPKNDLSADNFLIQMAQIVHIEFRGKDGVIRVAAISVIGVFAAAVIGAVVVALVREIQRCSAGRSEASPPSVSAQAPIPTSHHAEVVDVEACEPSATTEGSLSSMERSKEELDRERWNRSTPSGRFERALHLFSDASEGSDSPSVAPKKRTGNSRLLKLWVESWQRLRRKNRRAKLNIPESPAPWPMPPPAVFREAQSVAV